MTDPNPNRMPPNNESAEASARNRLFRAAAELFSRKGYSATSVSEIVETAGVTKPVLYYHFGSKEGLYLKMLEAAAHDVQGRIQQSVAAPGDAVTRIRNLCDALMELVITHLALVRLMHAMYYGPPQGAPYFDFDAVHQMVLQATIVLVEEGVREGSLRPDDATDVAWVILGVTSTCMDLQLCHADIAPGRVGLQRLLGLVLAGLATPAYLSRGERS
jgi:AcrR family transcriptional regulator